MDIWSDFCNHNSLSRGVVIMFIDDKESKDFSDSFGEWTKDAVKKGASLETSVFFHE